MRPLPRERALVRQESAWEGPVLRARAPTPRSGIDPGAAGGESGAAAGRRATVADDLQVDFERPAIEASPDPSQRPPNYYPGGRVAGRPVPAGWYSEPWWKPALVAGAWGLGSVLLFDAMFSGMHGVDYGAQGFESGYGDGYSDGFDAGQDAGADGGGFDGGGDGGGFDGGSDGGGWGGDSWGGGDFGGGDFGGGDFGGF